MSGRLAGKSILITAAGQGIGRATAEACIREGARVWATDRAPELLQDLAGAETAALDVTDRAAIDRAAAEYQPDILIYCAGVVHAGTVLGATTAEFDAAIGLNARGAFEMIQAVLPHMQARKSGAIIAIGSVASNLMGVPNRCVYGASKAALAGLIKSVARDFIEDGIRANCICPGTVDSPSLHGRLAATGDYDRAKIDFIARQPMGRIGKAEEIAALAVYLASDESAYMTGQECIIDGGMSL